MIFIGFLSDKNTDAIINTIGKKCYPVRYTCLRRENTMKSVFALMALALAGCTTVGSIQADCQKSTSTFGAMAQCIDAGIAQQPRLAGHPSVQLYTLKARQLSQRVEAGQISDLDARVELQQLFVAMRQQEVDAPMPQTPQRATTRSTCMPGNGGTMTCVSR